MSAEYVTAVYLRISDDDGRYGDSQSIEGQRDLIRDFIRSHPELKSSRISEFADDGYSGTNFKRPGVTELLQRARRGDIQCIVVNQMPDLFRLYEAGEALILEMFPDVTITAKKTQVSFSNRYGFAYLWPPLRKIKGRPGPYIVLSFGLGYRAEHPRIVESAEPYPGRWTHHVLISSTDELDEQVRIWLREAYDFSLNKGRQK